MRNRQILGAVSRSVARPLLLAALLSAGLAVPGAGPVAVASTGDSYGSSHSLNIPAQRERTVSRASRRAVKAAEDAYAAGDAEAALAALAPALEKGDSADAFGLLARIHLDRLEGGPLQAAVAKGLTIDPAHTGLREVIGRAYVVAGEVPLAEEQLQIIRKICRGKCPERDRLAEAITAAKATPVAQP